MKHIFRYNITREGKGYKISQECENATSTLKRSSIEKWWNHILRTGIYAPNHIYGKAKEYTIEITREDKDDLA